MTDRSADPVTGDTAFPAPPGRRTVRTAAPPKRTVTQEDIIGAVLEIARDEGVDTVTVRRLATALAIAPGTLYQRFANMDELLELALDEAMSAVVLPTPDPARWTEQISEIAAGVYQVLTAYGDIARVALGDLPMRPNALRVGEALLAVLDAGGIGARLAALAKDRIMLYTYADAYTASVYLAKERRYGHEAVTAFLDQARAYYRNLPPSQFPHTCAMADELMSGTAQERFQTGLQMLVNGLLANARRQ